MVPIPIHIIGHIHYLRPVVPTGKSLYLPVGTTG